MNRPQAPRRAGPLWSALLGAARMLAPALLVVLVACGSARQTIIVRPDGNPFVVEAKLLRDLEQATAGDEEEPLLPVDRVLVAAGHYAVERLIVTPTDGARSEYDWPRAADDAVWLDNGRLSIQGREISPDRIEVIPPALLERVEAGITDLAPTAAAALGLPSPAQATGRPLTNARVARALLLFLDGLGYVRFQEAMSEGLVPNLAALPAPLVGLTVYPPSTNVGTAALLTGAPPEVNGVNRRGIRQTQAQTLLEVAASAGRSVEAVEGSSLSFNLPGAGIELSGDRDGNGSTDDNVLANALDALAGGMPNLLLVHFHGIDDAGHTYGIGSPEEKAALRTVDGAVGAILDQVPAGTLVLAFADHGMHAVAEEGRAGNHGRLVERDMFVPIWVVVR